VAVLTPGKNAGTPICFTPFCFNALCQLTPHLNFHCLFFCSTPMAGCTLGHCQKGESQGTERNWLAAPSTANYISHCLLTI